MQAIPQIPSPAQKQALLALLRARIPQLWAVYGFGSRVQGHARADSDLDMAVLVAGYVDPLLLWEVAADMAELVHCPVDLLDLRAASTVMQYQIITTGQRWWAHGVAVGVFEAAVLSEKTALDQARAGLLAEIQATGSVYGR